MDLAIVTVASFHEVRDYPEWLVRDLHPKHILLSHWEDFFTSSDMEERTVRLTNVRTFLNRLTKVVPADQVTMLRRHGRIELIPPRDVRPSIDR